uniref:Uncharacterized protein n=1 Tax=Brugia malayi TaxID=6279 RepID=A8Q6Z5_BRUMA
MDREQTGHIAELGFQTNFQLREHLVECHAKFVARALLAPNVTKKTHFWLLTNIAYHSENVGDDFLCDAFAETALESTKQSSIPQDDRDNDESYLNSQKQKPLESDDPEEADYQPIAKRSNVVRI